MTSRPITIDELRDKYQDAWDIARDDDDYEGMNLISEFMVDLADLERTYGQR